ncbi:hypothetical protein ACMGE5_00665 [Macrococcus equi]|uniref:hypothetical protein n=1 Tax=Macrococcus equi TaxID=3395462 RepID=UPI0039BEBD40
MKKLIVSTVAASLLLTGAGFEKAEAAKKITETKINYLSKTTAYKLKAGKITSLDGMKLNTKRSKYLPNIQYSVSEYSEDMELNNVSSNNEAIFDFTDHFGDPIITRLVDYVGNDYNASKMSASAIRKLYGKPLYAQFSYDDKYKRDKNDYAMIYKNMTFYFDADSSQTELKYVVIHGNTIKNNLNKWRYFNFVDKKDYLFDAVNQEMSYENWKYYYAVK